MRRITRDRESAEAELKKKLDQACWVAEKRAGSVIEIADRQRGAPKVWDARMPEITELENNVHSTMSRYKLAAFRVDTHLDDALKQKLAADPAAMLAPQRAQADILLEELNAVRSAAWWPLSSPIA